METQRIPSCVVLGGGGHARVLIDCITASGLAQVSGILDCERETWGKEICGVPVLGDDSLLGSIEQHEIDSFVVGLGATGNNDGRCRLFQAGLAAGLQSLTAIHPAATFSQWADLGRGAQLMAHSIVNAGAALGENVIVNSGAIVEHDCLVGEHAHIATGARLAGSVVVGDGAHVGIGAVVKQNTRIGAGAIVGAGAVVVADVIANTIVVGVPARFLRNV
jgi:sugar O-acyltransferase (sialic acid O-acetyltransferase NeuD family)